MIFRLQYHRWSSQAAVNARWFDTKSQKLGDEYRDEVFAHQMSIETPDDLRAFTDKFAKDHGVALPFVIDPQGKLAAAVKADYDLGVRLGVHQTPTVWIVTDKHGVTNATEVTDFSKLYSMLDAAVASDGRQVVLRSGFVSILGRPNTGKSTLLNALVGEKVAIVTSKPQTTRTRIHGVVEVAAKKGKHPAAQIVFVDTPGVHKPGSWLDRRMMQEVHDALESRDVVLLMVDATRRLELPDR